MFIEVDKLILALAGAFYLGMGFSAALEWFWERDMKKRD